MAYISMLPRAPLIIFAVAFLIAFVLSVEQEIRRWDSIYSSRLFSTNKPAAKNLIKVLESEIEFYNRPVEIKDGIEFEIEDIPGEDKIRLTRKLSNETIEVEVNTHPLVDDGDNRDVPNIAIGVKISKGSGEKLEFQAYLNLKKLEIIGAVSIKNPPNPEGLLQYGSPKLQKPFMNYLEIKGIKPSLANLLYDYLFDVEPKEYVQDLKNLKSFVEK